MKLTILTMFAALGLLAQNAPAPATQPPANSGNSKGSSSAPASTDSTKKTTKHHKKNAIPNASTNSTAKPATGNSGQPAAPASK